MTVPKTHTPNPRSRDMYARAPLLTAYGRALLLAISLLVSVATHAGESSELATEMEENLDFTIPSKSDWQDYGTILRPGSPGEWDAQLFGGFAGSIVKRHGIYYLYYQGASGYREIDQTVTWRAIGVALSTDGVNFVKHEDNPVLTWLPNDNGEEGAVSSAAALDRKKRVILYYGANSEETATTVNADSRLAISKDGLRFRDKGIVLSHSDRKLWGFGDEVFPIIAFRAAKRWHVYYIPNGVSEKRLLGVAWGPRRKRLRDSAEVRGKGKPIPVWGMGGHARVGPRTFALFLNDGRVATMEVRLVSVDDPTTVSEPIRRYRFADFRQGTVLLDERTSTWFLYYRSGDQDRYGVKLAPAGPPDTSPPTAPANLRLSAGESNHVTLTWDPSEDSETGIVQYRIYRDGRPHGRTKGTSFREANPEPYSRTRYRVSAVNYHGFEGPQSAPAVRQTLAAWQE